MASLLYLAMSYPLSLLASWLGAAAQAGDGVMTAGSRVSVLTITNLVKRWGSSDVLKGVGLRVERGTVGVLIGPSGCGKTTVLRCVNGLEPFQEGESRWERPVSRRDVQRPTGTIAATPPLCGNGLSAIPSVPASLRAGECDRGADPRAGQAARSRRQRGACLVGSRRTGRSLGCDAAPTLGRPATARRRRAGAGHAARRCCCSTSRPARSIQK